MSDQSDVNSYPDQFLLYYCGFYQADPTVYQQDCSNVCAFSYNGITGDLQVDTWYLLGYSQPSMGTLTSFALVDVLVWFDNFYTRPAEITNSQFNKYTTAQLAACRMDSSMVQYCVYNTDTQRNQYWTGSAWTDCFPMA
jgi:hypothetical protein